jgi:hypothetical protein
MLHSTSFSGAHNADLRAAVTKALDRAAASVALEVQRAETERRRADEAERLRNVERASSAALSAQLLTALLSAQRRADGSDAERRRLAEEVERLRSLTHVGRPLRCCSIV